MGTDKKKEPQPLLELEHQDGQRRMEKNASNKNSPGNLSLPSAILLQTSSKMTTLETTGQTK